MPRHLRGRLTYANVAATLALFIAVGAGIAYAADGDAGSCDNIKPDDIAAPIQGGKIGVPTDTLLGRGPAAAGPIQVDGDGILTIRHAAISIDSDDVLLDYSLSARSDADRIERTESITTGLRDLSSVEFSFPVKRGRYEIHINVNAREVGTVTGSLASAVITHTGDWTYQLLPKA